MTNASYIQQLNEVLASTYAVYLKTQSYHWHVTGINFHSIHKMFESQYKEYAEAIDEIAERIRALSATAEASFAAFEKNSCIGASNPDLPAQGMLHDLVKDQEKILDCLNDTLGKAQKINDEGTINILSDRIAVHEKNRWMLKVSGE